MLLKMSLLTVVMAMLMVTYLTSARPSSKLVNCGGKPADIVFLLDTSKSIWQPDFDFRVKPFVRDVVAMFDIGPAPSQTRVGVVTFSDEYFHEFHLNEYMDQDSLATAIEQIEYIPGETYTNKAIVHARETMFTAENGARDDVPHIAIILTDGVSSSTKVTLEEAEVAKSEGVQIYAIGVGYRVNLQELRGLASKPDSEFVFHVSNFGALDSIKKKLAIRTCHDTVTTPSASPASTSTSTSTSKPSTTTKTTQSTTTSSTTSTTTTPMTTTTTTTKPTTTPKPTRPTETPSTTERPIRDRDSNTTDCWKKPADVYFLLDASSSIWIKHFNDRVLKFARDMVQVFDIGPTKTRVGVVTFSNKTKAVFDLDDYTSKDELMKAIRPETVKHLTGGTNTASAIAYVRDRGFSPKVARPGVAQIIIVITDGLSHEPELTALEAAKAQKSGIYMFAIGVGFSVDMNELKYIASDPDDDFVFHVDNFDALDTLKEILVWQTCKVKSASPKSDNLDSADKKGSEDKGLSFFPPVKVE